MQVLCSLCTFDCPLFLCLGLCYRIEHTSFSETPFSFLKTFFVFLQPIHHIKPQESSTVAQPKYRRRMTTEPEASSNAYFEAQQQRRLDQWGRANERWAREEASLAARTGKAPEALRLNSGPQYR